MHHVDSTCIMYVGVVMCRLLIANICDIWYAVMTTKGVQQCFPLPYGTDQLIKLHALLIQKPSIVTPLESCGFN